ncbi:MAG: hypothetical protein HY904_14385 [Deltaproteobacteria bacterium]|nr:hypothetical protein [Deltaproteobacteria bacterium]
MCTIGSVVDRAGGRIRTFKQCDLPVLTRFLPPSVEEGADGIWYLPFRREGAAGPWAGVNNYGVALVAADAYLDPELNNPSEPEGDALEAYEHVVARFMSAQGAAEFMAGFYEDLGAPDIVLVSDPREAFLVEYSPTWGVRVAHAEAGFLASTNHFQLLPGGITEDQDPSTHARLARAVDLLGEDPSTDGVHDLLCDQAYGATDLSICRVAERPGGYFTQASVLFEVDEDGRVDCAYQLNGNPRATLWVPVPDVFG